MPCASTAYMCFPKLANPRCRASCPAVAGHLLVNRRFFAVHLENPWFSRCTGIRPISQQKYAILCASTVSRISVGCTAHCLRSLYHVMGEQKIPKLSDSDTIFCCRFCRNHPFNTLYIPGGFCLQSVL